MAGQTIASFSASVTPALVTIMPAVPAGKAESVCLLAAIAFGGAADTFINVLFIDPVSAPTGVYLLYNEPIRYRQPGGNVLLLQNFIVPAGASLQVQETGASVGLHVTLFNRWRFDPVAGQNMPTAGFAVLTSGNANLLGGAIPAGKAESVCVQAALGGVAADGYVHLTLFDPVNAPGGLALLWQEPVRFRQPGGSPVLLLNYIVSAGCSLFASCAVQNVHVTVFNRWRFDA